MLTQRSNQDPAGQALQLTATGGSHNRSTGFWGLPGSRGRPQGVHSSYRYGTPGQGMLHHLQSRILLSCKYPHTATQTCIKNTPGTQTPATHAKQSAAVHCQILEPPPQKRMQKPTVVSAFLMRFTPLHTPKIQCFGLIYLSHFQCTLSKCLQTHFLPDCQCSQASMPYLHLRW